jgi:hypothetical protein
MNGRGNLVMTEEQTLGMETNHNATNKMASFLFDCQFTVVEIETIDVVQLRFKLVRTALETGTTAVQVAGVEAGRIVTLYQSTGGNTPLLQNRSAARSFDVQYQRQRRRTDVTC